MFINRDENGNLVRIDGAVQGFGVAQYEGQEWIAEDSPELAYIDPTTLDEAKSKAIAAIDEAAGDQRQRYLTCAAGQDMVYMEKRAQAKEYKAAVNSGVAIGDNDFLFLRSSLGVDGATLEEVADGILTAFDSCQRLLSRIERARLVAKNAVTAAATKAEVQAAIDGIDWELA